MVTPAVHSSGFESDNVSIASDAGPRTTVLDSANGSQHFAMVAVVACFIVQSRTFLQVQLS